MPPGVKSRGQTRRIGLKRGVRFVLLFAAKIGECLPTCTNGFVGIAEGNASTNGTIENADLGASQQIVGRNPQDQPVTPHLYSPVWLLLS